MVKSTNPFTKLPIFYGWIVIAVAFITMAVVVNARTAFSLLFPAILDEFQWDRGVIAGAFSIGFVASGALTPIMGFAMDRWGPRVVIPIGGVMVISGLLGATIVSSPIGFYIYLGVLVISGSVAMTYFVHSMFLPNWFVRKRGLAIGIAFSGAGIGSITLLPWFQTIIDSSGWREACIVISGVVAVIIPLTAYFQRLRPQELGLEPDGDAAVEEAKGKKMPDPIVDKNWVETDWTLGLAIRTSRFWWVFCAYFTALYAWYAVLVHQTVYLIESGFDSTTAATALGLVALFGIAGQICVGALSDRIGREGAWTLALMGYIVCYGILLELPNTPSNFLLYLMVAMQGLLGFGLSAIYGSVTAEIFTSRHFASIFAVCGLGGNVGAGVGPWLTGYLFDNSGSYQSAFWLCIVMCITSIFCMWMAAPRKVRLVAGRAAKRANAS